MKPILSVLRIPTPALFLPPIFFHTNSFHFCRFPIASFPLFSLSPSFVHVNLFCFASLTAAEQITKAVDIPIRTVAVHLFYTFNEPIFVHNNLHLAAISFFISTNQLAYIRLGENASLVIASPYATSRLIYFIELWPTVDSISSKDDGNVDLIESFDPRLF